MQVKLYIGNNPSKDLLTFRYFRNVLNPEAYKDCRKGEKLVVNGMNVANKIVGEITDIINDPDHDNKDIFVRISESDLQLAISTGTWIAIETP